MVERDPEGDEDSKARGGPGGFSPPCRRSSTRAVVVGGGIGGLAAAIGLRGAGWDVTVHEQAPAIHEVGAGMALWANGLRALDALGVGDAVRVVGAPDFGGALRKPSGEVLAEIDADAAIAGHGLLGIVLHRAELLEILLSAAGPVRTGRRCTGVRRECGRAVVSFGDDQVEADLVVGADGLNSVVRASLFGERPPRYSGVTAWRAVVDVPDDDLCPRETWGHRQEFGRVAMADGRAYFFVAARMAEGVRFADEVAAVRRRFGDWHDPIPPSSTGWTRRPCSATTSTTGHPSAAGATGASRWSGMPPTR